MDGVWDKCRRRISPSTASPKRNGCCWYVVSLPILTKKPFFYTLYKASLSFCKMTGYIHSTMNIFGAGTENIMRIRWLLLIILLCPVSGYAQYSYKEEQVVFSENVLSDVVFGTFRKDGFLYVATQRGLYLYDGYIFVKAKNIINGVHHFYSDGNKMYLEEGNVGLISLQDIYAEKKILKKVVYTDSDQNNDHYENIYKDSFGNIWCSDFHQIKFLNPQNNITSFVINKDNKHLNLDIHYLPIKNGLLITSDFGIFLWNNSQSGSLTPISSDKITSATRYNGHIYVTQNNRTIHEFSMQDNKLKEPCFDINDIRFVQQITDGTPLIAYSQNQVFELDMSNRSKRLIYTSEDQINHIFYDQESGIFWISTPNGLVKLIREKNIIKDIELPAPRTITAILETEKGIFWFADNNGNIIRKNGNDLKTYHLGTTTYQLSFSEGILLIGAENGVYSINPTDRLASFRKIISTTQKIKKALIHKGKIWALPETGKIGIYDAQTFRPIPDFIKNNNTFFHDVLFNDIMEHNGRIWIASWLPKDFGITYFDESSQTLKQAKKGDEPHQVFVGDYYSRVNGMKDGSMIFSSYGGWNVVSQNGKIRDAVFVDTFGINATTNIQGMAEDHAGNIWLGCEEGLYRYNPKTNSSVRISKKDGLASNNVIYGFLMSNDLLYFSTEKKVQQLDIHALQKLKLFNNLKITGIKIDGQYLPDLPDKMSFPEASAQQIDIYFSVLNFWGKDKVKYRYHFGDEAWNELGNDPRISLVKLRQGNYNIFIEAYDDLDENYAKSLQLQLRIIPPFYKTIWFFMLSGLCLSAIAFGISRYLIHREKETGILMKKAKEIENKMLRSQMNPHFLFNSMNSINSFIIQNKKEEASAYLTLFSKLIRKILDNSRKDLITLKDELDTIRLYLDLEAVRLDHKFDYSISIDKTIDKDDIEIPALVLQPFLENAVWHGIHPKMGNGFIEIVIGREQCDNNCCLNIKIEDDGIGRQAAARKKKETLHKSHGLDITLERLQMSDARNKVELIDLYDDNNAPAGTLVKLKIYYSND